MPIDPAIFRLWEDSQEALILPDTPAAELVQGTLKGPLPGRRRDLVLRRAAAAASRLLPGRWGAEDTAIARIEASDAFMELVKHSFLLDIQARDLIASHFDQLSRLVDRRIFYRLDYPRRFALLPLVRSAIVHHCAE